MGQPARTCIGCRARADKNQLVRLVRDGQGVVVDDRQVAPGRGAYLHREPQCLLKAVRRRALGRALRTAHLDASGLEEALHACAGSHARPLGEIQREGIDF